MLDTTIWLNFWNNLALPNVKAMHALKNLEKPYQEIHRAYHTLEHINECVFYWGHVKQSLENSQAVLMAIYFHDAVYDPTAQDNEEKSVAFMYKFFEEYLPNNYIEKQLGIASKMILLTKQHGKLLNNLSVDEKYLMDIDCSILGSSIERFEKYEQQIRIEYKVFSDEIFYPHRKKFLEQCQNNRIFYTEEFNFYLGKKVKRNIEHSLKNKAYHTENSKVEIRV